MGHSAGCKCFHRSMRVKLERWWWLWGWGGRGGRRGACVRPWRLGKTEKHRDTTNQTIILDCDCSFLCLLHGWTFAISILATSLPPLSLTPRLYPLSHSSSLPVICRIRLRKSVSVSRTFSCVIHTHTVVVYLLNLLEVLRSWSWSPM